MRRRALFKLASVILLGPQVTSCSRSVLVPPASYDAVDSGEAKYWRVTTTDERTYWVQAFAITDSTLVITRASRLHRPHHEPTHIEASDLPIVLSLDAVAKLERRDADETATIVAVTVVVSALTLAIIYLAGVWAVTRGLAQD